MDAYNSYLDCTETINQFGVERPLLGWYECERLTHSQQQSQAPNAKKNIVFLCFLEHTVCGILYA